MDRVDIQVREARPIDRQRLANLIHFEEYVHRHLDWKPVLDWIGCSPFLISENENKLLGALASPADPATVAWLRLFAVASSVPLDIAWKTLWTEAEKKLASLGVQHTYALALQDWFIKLMVNESFPHVQDVIVLAWEAHPQKLLQANGGVRIRLMDAEDLSKVCKVDNLAFELEWRNSENALGLALRQSSIATIAEIGDEVVGYQISTTNPMGGHLARLAVLPERQGQGIGSVLVYSLLEAFKARGVNRVTVNTQSNNLASLSIYRKYGFQSTGEAYPVFQLSKV